MILKNCLLNLGKDNVHLIYEVLSLFFLILFCYFFLFCLFALRPLFRTWNWVGMRDAPCPIIPSWGEKTMQKNTASLSKDGAKIRQKLSYLKDVLSYFCPTTCKLLIINDFCLGFFLKNFHLHAIQRVWKVPNRSLAECGCDRNFGTLRHTFDVLLYTFSPAYIC